MEKAQLLKGGGAGGQTLPLGGQGKTKRPSLARYVVILLGIAALVRLFSTNSIHSSTKKDVVLGKLLPTKCWNEKFKKPFKCYHLYAPLDHLNETDERTARLAVATYPAGGGKTKKKDILGTLLLNPGK